MAGTFVGCSGSQQSFQNPFATADRVPPPITRTPGPGVAQPYYSSTPAPVQPSLAAPQPLSQAPPVPRPQIASTGGDSIAIPTDSSSLRFGVAARGATPAPTLPAQDRTLVASRPATANGWISGSAPERSMPSTRVRIPNSQGVVREPVSVANLNPAPSRSRFEVKPLESPSSEAAGDSTETLGWR